MKKFLLALVLFVLSASALLAQSVDPFPIVDSVVVSIKVNGQTVDCIFDVQKFDFKPNGRYDGHYVMEDVVPDIDSTFKNWDCFLVTVNAVISLVKKTESGYITYYSREKNTESFGQLDYKYWPKLYLGLIQKCVNKGERVVIDEVFSYGQNPVVKKARTNIHHCCSLYTKK